MSLNRFYLNKPDSYIAIVQTCTQVYSEVRSYLVENQVAYIPVMVGMDYNYGQLNNEYCLTQATKDTIAAALTDFANVHFHLHVDLVAGANTYNPHLIFASLRDAIQKFQAHSTNLFIKRRLNSRRATVHLDHLLSLWPKFPLGHCGMPVGALKGLVDLLAKDKATDWEIRYYVPTGQANKTTTYGNYFRATNKIRDAELAQLRACAGQSDHAHIAVFVKMYGEDTTWEYGDKTGSVVRHRTPATEFWPNVHFDPRLNHFRKNWHFVKTYPRSMPLEYFEDEALAAAEEDSETTDED